MGNLKKALVESDKYVNYEHTESETKIRNTKNKKPIRSQKFSILNEYVDDFSYLSEGFGDKKS